MFEDYPSAFVATIVAGESIMAGPRSSSGSSDSVKADDIEVKEASSVDQLDLVAYYENNAGRLVVDPE